LSLSFLFQSEGTVSDASNLSLTSKVVRDPGVVEAEIDHEVVAINIETGNCYGLNPVGSRIWNLIAAPVSVGDVCARLVSEYQVQQSACEQQVLSLLEELRAEGLISTVPEK